MRDNIMYDGIISKPNLDETYLSHHGILGQKWGKKNGPPYPLSSKISTGKSLKKGASAKKKKPDRYERAANASARDAEDLRRHGYTKEADAVQKVSDQQRAKSKTANEEMYDRKKKKPDRYERAANTVRYSSYSGPSLKERYDSLPEDTKKAIKTTAIVTGALAAGALAAYGGTKLKILSDATKYGKGVQSSVKSLLAEQLDKAYDLGDLKYAMPKSLDKALTQQTKNIGSHYKEIYKWETKRAIRDTGFTPGGIRKGLRARDYNMDTFGAEYIASLADKYEDMSAKYIKDNWEEIFGNNEVLDYIKKHGSTAYRMLK